MNKKTNKICAVICVVITVIMIGLIVFAMWNKNNQNTPIDTTQTPTPDVTVPNEDSDSEESEKVPVVIPDIIDPIIPNQDKVELDVSEMTRDPEPNVGDSTVEYDTKN